MIIRFSTIALAVLTTLSLVSQSLDASSTPGRSKAANREYFTDLKLLTHEGREVRFYSDVLEDRVVLVSGFYTNCTSISPRQNLILSRLQNVLEDELGRDVWIVSITVDPERDTLEELEEYAKVFHSREGWLFLTGKVENVNWVNYKLGQYLENLEDHKGVYLLGNLRTGLWKKAPAHAQLDDLVREIHTLLEDRGQLENE